MIARSRECLLAYFVILCFPSYSITGEWSPLTLNPSYNDKNKSSAIFDISFLDEFRRLVESGKLSLARRKALEALQNPSPSKCKKNDISKVYAETFKESYDAGGNEYLRKIIKYIHTNNQPTLIAKKDSPNCSKTHSDWSTVDPYQLWDESCSILPSGNMEMIIRPSNEFSLSSFSWQKPFSEFPPQAQCCVFTPGSWTYLRLPAIHEPAIRLGIPYHHDDGAQQNSSRSTNVSTTFLNLEQDGYLRPFDVAGILWPTGYMISLCLGDLVGCPIPELRVLITEYQQSFIPDGTSNPDELYRNHPLLALELGTGIGASSIALAKSLQKLGFPFSSSHDPNNQPWVVATDLAPHALALAMANAKSNSIDLGTAIMDHSDQSSVQDVKKRFFPQKKEHVFETDLSSDRQKQKQPYHTGFSLIFGSSLQGLFQETDRLDSTLWRTLDQLLDTNNPNALVILAHNRADTLKIPPDSNFSYHLVRRLSASDEFFGNMKSRAGDESDFEISVLQPRPTQCREMPLP